MTTLAELNALRVENGKAELKSWKQSKDKLEAAIVSEMEDRAKRLADSETPSDVSDVEEAESLTAEPIIPRGAIGAMSIELLTASDEPYADIVAKIVAKYPTAKTTPRSLASVAMDLRRDGVEVPSRRKPAKVKTDEAAS